jgi:hypothetical protein
MLLHSLTQGSDGYPLKAGQIRRDKKELRSFLSRFAVVAGVTRETTSNVGTILQRRALPLTTELGKDSGLNSPLLQSTVGTFTARNSALSPKLCYLGKIMRKSLPDKGLRWFLADKNEFLAEIVVQQGFQNK